MAEEPQPGKPLAAFIGGSDKSLNKRVLQILERLCYVHVDPKALNAFSLVVVAHSQSLPSPGTYDQLHELNPRLLMFVTEGPVPMEPIQHGVVEKSTVVPLSHFGESLAEWLSDAPKEQVIGFGAYRDKVFQAHSAANWPSPSETVLITCDPALTPEAVTATLTALANYYRACGGVGLAIEFENQEAVPEITHV